MFGGDYSLWYSWQHFRKRLTPKNDHVSMRWKLLVLVSFVAALLALGLWSAITIAVFGSARALARNDWLLLLTAIVPLAIAAYSGVFVYRHTARRRKTQAALTVILSLLLTLGTYLTASLMFPNRLVITPPLLNGRPAR